MENVESETVNGIKLAYNLSVSVNSIINRDLKDAFIEMAQIESRKETAMELGSFLDDTETDGDSKSQTTWNYDLMKNKIDSSNIMHSPKSTLKSRILFVDEVNFYDDDQDNDSHSFYSVENYKRERHELYNNYIEVIKDLKNDHDELNGNIYIIINFIKLKIVKPFFFKIILESVNQLVKIGKRYKTVSLDIFAIVTVYYIIEHFR